MFRIVLILSLCLLFRPLEFFGQYDDYAGTWKMEYLPGKGLSPILLEIQIATPEKNMLYPAQLTIRSETFIGEYQLLLVKKAARELGISRNKFPVSETPFSLGYSTFFLNGILEYTRDIKGMPLLTARRMPSKLPLTAILDTTGLLQPHRSVARHIGNFLKEEEIIFKKINNVAWRDEERTRILNPGHSEKYFGLQDSIHLDERDATLFTASSKKTNTDVVTVSLNGRLVLDQVGLNKKKRIDEIQLDTGLNILAFFADNFGSQAPNKGKLNIEFFRKKFALDFTTRADSGATFIVAKLYYDLDKAKDKYFQSNHFLNEPPLQKHEKLISSITTNSRELVLAIWDDATEDGDSISINIDGRWLVQGFPVRKTAQFIPVTLKPGQNIITFMADNLGSIPPNTSVLEIIDGVKRKSFTMETQMGENNLVKIFYEIKPG